MKVILQDNVQKLGEAGDVVDISRGFFRNFLEPRGLAVLATKGTLKKREEDLAALRRKADKARAEAVALAEKISALPTLRISVKAGESGKLYGKITHKELATLIEKEVGAPIDKRLLKADDIGNLGSYKILVKLAPEVQGECTVDVLQEGAPIKEAVVAETKAEEAEESAEEKDYEEESSEDAE
jgi:ribosomal protein L9